MKQNAFSILFCCLIVILASYYVRKKKPVSKKKTLVNQSYIYTHAGKAFGILRVECSDCQLSYTVNNKNFTVDIKDGNEDRFIYPEPSSYVKTILKSKSNQMIRILAINPNGNVVSNVLDSFKTDEERRSQYLMQCIKIKSTIMVNTAAR
ncbi:hypothetical protein [Pedobacter hartonius]|uniref:Uncharacterized protein n=1 Tax=Pedobacter hartonius TaxID=425514 RepID=A0A1H4GKC7_9SPHI|nr:hypothetical protein [Pedobacter hartonius]SEB09440.1 hypothetical protein SAMN05443550_110100 [Pedobacter hartonius]